MSARSAILITGGARRVGAALARHFAASGYDIALHYNRSESDAKQLAKEMEATGAKCTLFAQDLRDGNALFALMEKVHKAMPGCVALINNASIFERAPLMDTDQDCFDRHMAINLKAPILLTQAFARYFGKGCVVNLLDANITKAQGSHFAYMLSKKALAEFTVMAAGQLGPDIRVNGVCPGVVLTANESDEAYKQKIEAALPLQAHPTLKELADAVYWLVTQPHLTGQLIFVDGGKHVL